MHNLNLKLTNFLSWILSLEHLYDFARYYDKLYETNNIMIIKYFVVPQFCNIVRKVLPKLISIVAILKRKIRYISILKDINSMNSFRHRNILWKYIFKYSKLNMYLFLTQNKILVRKLLKIGKYILQCHWFSLITTELLYVACNKYRYFCILKCFKYAFPFCKHLFFPLRFYQMFLFEILGVTRGSSKYRKYFHISKTE